MNNTTEFFASHWKRFVKHFIWMGLSYVALAGCAWLFILKPQAEYLAVCLKRAAVIEASYNLLTSAPNLPDSISAALAQVESHVAQIEWLNRGPDPTQMVFKHLDSAAILSGLRLTELTPTFGRTQQAGEKQQESEGGYYTWEVTLEASTVRETSTGQDAGNPYGDLCRFVSRIEGSPYFLSVLGLSVQNVREGTVFKITLAGLRRKQGGNQ